MSSKSSLRLSFIQSVLILLTVSVFLSVEAHAAAPVWQLGPCGRGALCADGATPLPTPSNTSTPDPSAPTPTPWPTSVATETPVPGAYALRVDVGASQGHSNGGLYWKADRDYSAASYGRLDKAPSYSSGAAVQQSADPGLFQSFRQGPAIEYQADVPDGVYAVVLHFAEFVAKAAGQRQMQLSLQGVTQTGSIDVYDQVQAGRALRLRYEAVTVSAGTLNFKLQAVAGKAELAAFEVRGLYTPGPTPTKTPQGAPLSLELLEPAGAVLLPQP